MIYYKGNRNPSPRMCINSERPIKLCIPLPPRERTGELHTLFHISFGWLFPVYFKKSIRFFHLKLHSMKKCRFHRSCHIVPRVQSTTPSEHAPCTVGRVQIHVLTDQTLTPNQPIRTIELSSRQGGLMCLVTHHSTPHKICTVFKYNFLSALSAFCH